MMDVQKEQKNRQQKISNMKINDSVILEAYNGSAEVPPACDPQENYWKLIGSKGIIVKDPFFCAKYPDEALKKERRVLVKFQKSFKDLALKAHNETANFLIYRYVVKPALSAAV